MMSPLFSSLVSKLPIPSFINVEKCGQVFPSLNPHPFVIIDHFILIYYGLL